MEKMIESLFDVSFRKYVTPSLVKYIYILAIALAAVQAILGILAGFSAGFLPGLIALVLAPVIFVFIVCFARVALETVISIFRVTNYAAEVARAHRSSSDSARGRSESGGGSRRSEKDQDQGSPAGSTPDIPSEL